MSNRTKLRGSKRFLWIVPEYEYERHDQGRNEWLLKRGIAKLLRFYPGYEVVYKRASRKRLFGEGEYVFFGYATIIRIMKAG